MSFFKFFFRIVFYIVKRIQPCSVGYTKFFTRFFLSLLVCLCLPSASVTFCVYGIIYFKKYCFISFFPDSIFMRLILCISKCHFVLECLDTVVGLCSYIVSEMTNYVSRGC